MWRRLMVMACACGVVWAGLAGCSAAGTGSDAEQGPSTPGVTATIPSQGRSLAQAGMTHAPADRIWLPDATELTYKADQPNALIVTGVLAQADVVQSYLSQTLPGLGWTITSEADGGILFEQGQWHGGYAVGADSWALTVRDDE